ncbi:MAG: nucleotide exchange factor GrpE [Flavobacteriales bacterium]|nr:nucleotide exchange factor GrpE [Flavobacteriales bacterium]
MENEKLEKDEINNLDKKESSAAEFNATENAENKDEKEDLQKRTEELNDKYLRLYSDFDNYRKRTQREKVELIKFAGEEIISALLPVIDDFDRAIKNMNENADFNSIKEGIELIHNKFISILKSKGLENIEDSKGKELNVEMHEAITQIEAPSEELKGKIVDELEKGYKLNGKVIRYTKVVTGI